MCFVDQTIKRIPMMLLNTEQELYFSMKIGITCALKNTVKERYLEYFLDFATTYFHI